MEILFDVAAAAVISGMITWIIIPEFLPNVRSFHSVTPQSTGVCAKLTVLIAAILPWHI